MSKLGSLSDSSKHYPKDFTWIMSKLFDSPKFSFPGWSWISFPCLRSSVCILMLKINRWHTLWFHWLLWLSALIDCRESYVVILDISKAFGRVRLTIRYIFFFFKFPSVILFLSSSLPSLYVYALSCCVPAQNLGSQSSSSRYKYISITLKHYHTRAHK